MNQSVLPEGWIELTLAKAISANGVISDGDWIESKDQDPDGMVRLIQLADIGDGDFRNKSQRFMTPEKAELLNCTYLNKGDVLIARMPDPLGRACIFPGVNQDAVTVVDICLIRTGDDSAIRNDLLKYWVNSPQYRTEIERNASGTTRKRITRKKLEQLVLPLPPLAEQQQIAARLDTLLAQVDTLKGRLDALPAILKRFRQSVLAAAVSGKLTEEWRAQHTDCNAAVQIEKLKKVRAELFSSMNKVDKPLKRQANPIELEPIPSTWCYSHIDLFLAVDRAGMKTGPFGSLLKKHEHTSVGVPVLGIENIDRGVFVEGSKIHITEDKAEELAAYDIYADDLIISRSGTVGDICVVPDNLGIMRFSTNIMRISFLDNSINPHFFSRLFLGSPIVLTQVAELCKGSTRLFLNQKILSSVSYPIPPLEEQTEIVRRVEQLFAFADQIEQRVKDAQARVNHLTQSILARAFRGELTADWRARHPELVSGEHSAEVLLARIQAERAAMQPARRTRRKKAG